MNIQGKESLTPNVSTENTNRFLEHREPLTILATFKCAVPERDFSDVIQAGKENRKKKKKKTQANWN